MTWTPKPNDRFYRLFVRTGLFLRWLFRVRVMVTGGENLPAPDPRNGASRLVQPGRGAVIAVTHFGYVDFAAAELVVWKHARAQLRFLIHQGAADHWLAGPAIIATGHVVVGHGFSARRAWRAPVRIHIGLPVNLAADIDAEAETAKLRETLQNGIDTCIDSFSVVPRPGDWWMPADLGGGAPSETERQMMDAQDLARGRRRGPD